MLLQEARAALCWGWCGPVCLCGSSRCEQYRKHPHQKSRADLPFLGLFFCIQPSAGWVFFQEKDANSSAWPPPCRCHGLLSLSSQTPSPYGEAITEQGASPWFWAPQGFCWSSQGSCHTSDYHGLHGGQGKLGCSPPSPRQYQGLKFCPREFCYQ